MSDTIMVVEDDEELQDFYTMMLEGEGWRIIRAYDGLEALETLQREIPDLIVLDMLMDEMMGDELYFALKEEPRFAEIPIVIASVLSEERCRHLMARDVQAIFLRKPFSRQQLLEAVRRGLPREA
jgi:CheY-like chemotaxis protein